MIRLSAAASAGRGVSIICLLGAVILPQIAAARPVESVIYLLPAPREAIVLAPFVLAQELGAYQKAKLEVAFVVVPGGFNVGEALAQGRGDLGGASGDTPILLRSKNFAVKGVALLGEHAFLTLMTRKGSVPATGDLTRLRIDVPSFKDTSYYALQKLAAQSPSDPQPVVTQARATAELVTVLGTAKVDGIIGTVDWGVKAERAGAAIDYRSVDEFYPAMAQAIMASETTISKRPAMVRRFVRATLKTLARISRDPEACAAAYEKAVPGSGYSHAEIVRIFTLLSSKVYGDPAKAGRFDDGIVHSAQTELMRRQLIDEARPPSEYYTNIFTGR